MNPKPKSYASRAETFISALARLIAAIGQNIQFVAFWAHLGVAALIVEHSGRFHWYATGVFFIGAAIKEFWFDARDETNPPQTFLDNLEDFLGWSIGALLGMWLR